MFRTIFTTLRALLKSGLCGLQLCIRSDTASLTHPNVCINISNQGPLPLVRDEKGEHPWERRERGALHSKQMSMLKDNIEDSYIDGVGASPPGHPASYSPGYQRLQKKPKVASYITSRPCTMLQAILCSFLNTFLENIVSGPEVQNMCSKGG